ncbi:hypothetical protein [Amycolatopsis taiwanensis]|uniref:hypothetical protein n=1 Tax=Amycolatopsis taiwanensis TaxID=342230 RepID=UPI0012EBD32F|nr:hypothetical protein [Amycolatopsis taiwanensis]
MPPAVVTCARTFVAHVTDHLDGAARVLTLVRGRRYPVRSFAVDICSEATVSEVRLTVVLTAPDAELLVRRLRRMPAVLSATAVGLPSEAAPAPGQEPASLPVLPQAVPIAGDTPEAVVAK